MTKYRCLTCKKIFEAPVKAREIRHQKYGGCTWGIGIKLTKKQLVELKEAKDD